MRLIHKRDGISKLSLTTLLIVAGIIGALISYTFIMGYYVSMGYRVPKETTINIEAASFPAQNATIFNVSILNPSYSPSNATVNQVKVITGDTVNNAEILQPASRQIKPGELKNFTCRWNWSNETGKEVIILAFIAEGQGAPGFNVTTPVMGIAITGTSFDAAETTNSFNVTVKNQPTSVEYVNISKIIVTTDTVQELTPSPPLPHALNPDESENFTVPLTWTYYRNKSITITVQTLQGYATSYTRLTPLPVSLTVTQAVFNETDTAHFNLTVRNSASSPAYANITRISVAMENGTSLNINETTPQLPNVIPIGAVTKFTCAWSWTYYRDKNITITVYQLEGPTATYVKATPPSVLLTITGTVFNATETNQFNVTVKNSPFSILDANITAIGVTPKGAQETLIANVTPALYYMLSPNSSVEFNCLWNWTAYQGENVTISVYAVGYTANYTAALPPQVNLTITEVLFNTTATTTFNVTVQNPELSPISVNITRITVRMENGTTYEINETTPALEYTLYPNTTITFTCTWDWTNYRSKNATVTVYTREDYRASYTQATPARVILTITDVGFNTTDTGHFNVTVQNSELSSINVDIINISVTLGNGTTFNVTDITPALPYTLPINSSVTFICSWNWSAHQNETLTITIYTQQGYTASTPKTTPQILSLFSLQSFDALISTEKEEYAEL